MRLAVLLVVVVVAAGCGSKKPDPYAQSNVALLDKLPVYPGAAAPKTTASGTSTSQFGARDWTLPAGARPEVVIRWYEQRLPERGWKLTGKSFNTLHATRRGAALSVGVRGRTLEAVANSRGG